MNEGKISQVNGAVLDVKFDNDKLPNLYNAIDIPFKEGKIVAEVMQHLGNDTVSWGARS